MELRNQAGTLLQNKNIVMFVVTFAFILGVISFYNGIEVLIAAFITICFIVLSVLGIIPKKFALLGVIMFYLGFFNAALRIKSFDDIALKAPCEITLKGQIVSIPEITAQTGKFYLQTDNGKVLVWVNDKSHDFEKFNLGNNFEISGSLRRPPAVSNPSQFDYAKFLQNHGAFSVIYTNSAKCKLLDTKITPKWAFLQNLSKLRSKILKVHAQYLKSPNIEILGGIVFGDDAVAPPEYIKSSFINSGLLHILAASGMNVAFIWGFWFFFMRRLKVEYKITLISGIFLVMIYTFMTGLGASVVRAALMLTFVLIGKLFDRDAHSVSLLSFVALLMLIFNPAYLNDIGFQMSFVATLGILTTGQALYSRTKDIKLPEAVKGDLTIPIVAQAWVAPAQMFYFNTFAPFSVFANIAIIPFLCVISFGGFVSSILAIFYPLTKYLCLLIDWVLNLFITAIVNISAFFSSLPNSLITTAKPAIFTLILYYLLLGIITLIIKYGKTQKLLTATLCVSLLMGLTLIKIPNNQLEIIAFDVQNADCFLVKTPKNEYYVIDTGKFSYTGKQPQAGMTIGKYLKDNGIRKIKGLIITHFDNDHAGGGAYMVENFKIEKVYVNTTELKTATTTELFRAVNITGTPFEIGLNGQIIENSPEISIKFLRPAIDNSTITDKKEKIKFSDNENSIQTLISYKDFDILFTGDAGIKAFNEIKNALPNNIDVLKVGHHGARNVTNIEMLKTISPQIAIISTGINRFGHPSKQTLENLHQEKINIFRTDCDHAIKISTDGKIIRTYTFNSKQRKFVKNKEFKAK